MNLFNRTSWQKLAAVFLAATLLVLSGCASSFKASASSSQKLVTHTFAFDSWVDKWKNQIDVLAYSYGDQYQMVSRKVEKNDQTLSGTSINAAMPVGEFLYVKWRIKSTGEELEDKVDLRNRLPANMFEHKVTFVIDGKQLYVYLVTPTAKKTDSPPILKTSDSRFLVTYEIYPNNTYKK